MHHSDKPPKDWNKIQAQWTIAGVYLSTAIGVVTLGLMWWLDQRAHNQPAGDPPTMPVAWWMPVLIVLAVASSGFLHYRAVIKSKQSIPALKDSPAESKLKIRSAHYGTGPLDDMDVTEMLDSRVKDALVFPVNNNEVGHDPSPGKSKRILVEYSYGNQSTFKAERPEYSRLVLPEDSWLQQEVVRLTDLQKTRIDERNKEIDDAVKLRSDLAVLQKANKTLTEKLAIHEQVTNLLRHEANKLKDAAGSPRIVPIRYTKEKVDAIHQFGIVLSNDGNETAYDIRINSFMLGGGPRPHQVGWIVTFQDIYRLAKGGEQTSGVEISGRNTGLDLSFAFEQWLKEETYKDPTTGDIKVPDPIQFTIDYRDHVNNWHHYCPAIN